MELQGKAVVKNPIEYIGQNGFFKQQLIIETQEQYPQKLPIDFVKEKTALLEAVSIGQLVTVQVNLRGSEHNGKHYLQLQGWKIV